MAKLLRIGVTILSDVMVSEPPVLRCVCRGKAMLITAYTVTVVLCGVT